MNHPAEKLRGIAEDLFEKTPVLFAYLYGSYAKGIPHPFSDLDVAVFLEEQKLGACLELELSLSLRIDEKLGHEVQSDLRVLNHLPLIVKGSILSEGNLIYSKDENRRIEFETQVRKAYFDFLPVIRLHRNAYREKVFLELESGIR
ncbi:MAG: nucleotidyltransferase domain-containing protein [Desulfatiglandales bacterium]